MVKQKCQEKCLWKRAIKFCHRSSDEEKDFDENVPQQEPDSSELHKTLYGQPNDKFLDNKDEALTFKDEQSDDGPDDRAANRQFYR